MLLRLSLARLLIRCRLDLALLLSIPTWGCAAGLATAQQLSFQSYGEAEGLTNAYFSCLHQDKAGYVYACTEHGLYVYDGRRYFNFGPRQGLPDGGIANGLAFDAQNRLIVRYPHRIFVSTEPIGPSTSPAALTFVAARSMVGPIPDDSSGQLVPWAGGAVFAGQGTLYVVRTSNGMGQPLVEFADGLLHSSGVTLQDPTPLAAQGSIL